jgi:hypothetical protein
MPRAKKKLYSRVTGDERMKHKGDRALKCGRRLRPEAPTYKKGDTLNVEGFSYGWYEGWDRETGDILVVVAGHKGEGAIPVAPNRVSLSSIKMPRE